MSAVDSLRAELEAMKAQLAEQSNYTAELADKREEALEEQRRHAERMMARQEAAMEEEQGAPVLKEGMLEKRGTGLFARWSKCWWQITRDAVSVRLNVTA